MKRFLTLFACALLMSASACAEALPSDTATPDVAVSADSEASPSIDFDLLTPENPAATPVAVDPIDKPTPTPAPTPSFVYETYENTSMGISFSIPYTWLLNPNTDHATSIQLVEPKEERMEPDGYQTRFTIEKYNMGLEQSASDAYARLEATLEEMATTFSSFTPAEIASGSFGDADGYYCYYKAEYNDGVKNYEMNGRIIVVAHGKALFQIRLTAPRNWYSYYNYLWRKVRSTIEYQ